MSAREEIFGKLRQSLGRTEGVTAEVQAELDARMASRPRGLIPDRGKVAAADLVSLFTERAEAVEATVSTVASLSDVPDAVAEFLAEHNQPADIKIAPHEDLTGIGWDRRPTLTVSQGRSDGEDRTSVTRAFAGIAETATLMLLAGPEGPTTLNFLPDNHIVVLRRSELVGAYEDAWDKLRDKIGPDGHLSRVVNLITGPSRTGDIEQTLELGAHGPLRLHIVILED